MSEEIKTQVHATVRVMMSLDVEVSWKDGDRGMVDASKYAARLAEEAVGQALGNMADVSGDRVKLAKGASPKGDPLRVQAKLELR